MNAVGFVPKVGEEVQESGGHFFKPCLWQMPYVLAPGGFQYLRKG